MAGRPGLVRRCSAALIGGALTTLACAPPLTPRPRPGLVGPQLAASAETERGWRFHPRAYPALRAVRPLGVGRELFVGGRGERWVVDAAHRSVAAAAWAAPEELLAALRSEAGRWGFVGASGTVYEAEQPLGPLLRANPPPVELVRLAAVGEALSGVSEAGQLFSAELLGARWVERAPRSEATFLDVALLEGGAGLALAAPEQYWVTADGGQRWKPLGLPRQGVTSLQPLPDGAVQLLGVFGRFVWRPPLVEQLEPLTGRPPEPRLEPKLPAPLGPSARAVRAGHAALAGERYVQLERADAKAPRWRWREGRLDGGLATRPAPQLEGCADVRLAVAGELRVVACLRGAASGAAPLELLRSVDGGRRLEPVLSAMAQPAQLRLALSSTGELMVGGVCVARADERGCRPTGLMVPRRGGSRAARAGSRPLALVPASLPLARGAALALGYSPSGERAYAVLRHAKTGAPALYVARAGAARFSVHELVPAADAQAEELPGSALPWGGLGRAGGLRADEDVGLSVGDDGMVTVALSAARQIITTDGEGERLGGGSWPPEARSVGGFGGALLAVTSYEHEHYESLDGAASWRPLGRLPASPCAGSGRDCEPVVACSASGCLLGDALTRLGWGGESEQPLPRPSSARRAQVTRTALLEPLSCSLAPEGWRSLPGVAAPPAAASLSHGRLAWFVGGRDLQTGEARLSYALRHGGPLEQRALLGPVAAPEQVALAVSNAEDGVAALRVSVGGTAPPQLAWFDAEQGRVHLATPSWRPAAPTLVTLPGARARALELASLSVLRGAAVVQPTSELGREVYLYDGAQERSLPAMVGGVRGPCRHCEPWLLLMNGALQGYWVSPQGELLLRAGTGDHEDAAMTVSEPLRAGRVAARSLGSVGGAPALLVFRGEERRRAARAALLPLQATGALVGEPLAAPTQAHLPPQLTPCSEQQRQHTPRVLAPWVPGTRRAVLISDRSEAPITLLTAEAVLHGTPEAPCVAAYYAEAVPAARPRSASGGERAVLLADALDASFLFRRVPSAPGSPPSVEVRRLRCELAPTASVPAEVDAQPGVQVLVD